MFNVIVWGLCYEYGFVLYIYYIGFVCCYSYDFVKGKVNGYSIRNRCNVFWIIGLIF